MIECTLDDLYEFNKLNKSVDNGKFKTNTRKGIKKINGIAITAKNSIQHKLTLSSGETIISSPDHLFFMNKWKKAKDFKYNDLIETKHGYSRILSNEILDERADLYDIEVDEVHEFYANDIVSHNSTLAKVITYLCYGKVEGANLRDLPNRVNKELWGRIVLESKGNLIEIERGINPNVFNIKINGEEHDVAGKTNLQDFLETEMYEIPYHVFKNVIILSVNDFKSFITMSPYDKKMIIDRIFGFSVINEMRELVKNKRKAVVNQIQTLDDEIRTLGDSIQSVMTKIEEIEKINEEKSNEKILNLKKKLVDLNENRNKLLDANEKAKAKISEYDTLTKESRRKEIDLTNDIKHTKKWLKLYENKTCPTCNSSLDSEFHQGVKKSKQNHLDYLISQYNDIKLAVKNTEDQLTDMRNKGRQISIKVGQLETQMKSFKDEIIKLAENESEDSNYFKQLIKEFNEKKETKGKNKLRIEGEDYYLTILENLMGEDGIKNLAIRYILPSFNNHIDVMSKEMGIPFGIRFDDKFNCTIHHLGEEISPKTLSTGERKKADFVIIMAMIKMIKVRFPSLNILFLDEIFSSIDSDGVYHIISILHETIRDVGLNTFVINHTVLPSEYFDKKIEITKDAGFSEFSVEVIG
jgi:DNA repair exonuclease SbcCD ATPase subunit